MERAWRTLNKIAPFALLAYFVVGLLAYVNIWPGSARFFYSSSTSGVIVRAATTILLVGFSVAVFICNPKSKKPPWRWVFIFGAVLLGNFIVMLSVEHSYTKQYVASLYGYLREISVTVGTKQLITMYLSSVSDFALGFSFMFLLPVVVNNKRQLLYLTLPTCLLMLLECGYSVFAERDKYLAIFTGDTEKWGGYNISIGATFGDKQEFGAFLTVGFCCAIISLFIVRYLSKKARVSLTVFFVGCATIFFIITFFTLCKTAIIANLLATACLAFGLLIRIYRSKKRILFWCLLSSIIVFATAVTLVLTIEPLHKSGFLNRFYLLVDQLFLSKVNRGIWSRFYLVRDYFASLNGWTFLFGLSKGGVSAYMSVASLEGPGLHTGFVYFQACYGLVAFVLYLVLFIMIIRDHVKLIKKETFFGLCLLGCLLCTIVLNLSENEVLLISGSAPIFLFNIFNVTFIRGYLQHA